jgi:large subunit ribosomal protein L5
MPGEANPEPQSEEQPAASVEEQPEASVEEQPEAASDGPPEATAETQPKAKAEKPKAKAAPARRRPAQSGRSTRGKRPDADDAAEAPPAAEGPPPPRLRDVYRNEIVPTMMQEFGFTNPMRVPRIGKIVLNIGMGEALTNSRAMEGATRDLTTISGQKPIITKARRSIAGFKIREGNSIGTAVTLRGTRMYHFLDRLVNMALPRIRDFRGVPRRGFDGRGNFTIGIREQIIFPEIDYNQIDKFRGLQVTITTTAGNDAEAIRLLELYGFPFVRQA